MNISSITMREGIYNGECYLCGDPIRAQTMGSKRGNNGKIRRYEIPHVDLWIQTMRGWDRQVDRQANRLVERMVEQSGRIKYLCHIASVDTREEKGVILKMLVESI